MSRAEQLGAIWFLEAMSCRTIVCGDGYGNLQPVKFDVYGRFQLEVNREGELELCSA
jgi:hypothetical protein